MAHDLCDRFEAELHILHVIHNLYLELPTFGMGLSFPGYVENIGERRGEMKAKAIEAVNQLVDSGWKHRVVTETRFGKPSKEIVQYATDHEIDMIVVGAHGQSGLTHFLIGSVAESVVRHAPCPVLTVRHRTLPPDNEDTDQSNRIQVHPLPVTP